MYCAFIVFFSDISPIHPRPSHGLAFSSSSFNKISPAYASNVHKTIAGKILVREVAGLKRTHQSVYRKKNRLE
jgi:hypothetical protein